MPLPVILPARRRGRVVVCASRQQHGISRLPGPRQLRFKLWWKAYNLLVYPAYAVVALRLIRDPLNPVSLTIVGVAVGGYLIWYFIRKPWRD
jgi:hypothetical protein